MQVESGRMSEEKPEEPKKFDVKQVLIEGCMDPKAKEVIGQMLERRLAELDPEGLQAKFILKLQNEVNQMPGCGEMLGADEEKTE